MISKHLCMIALVVMMMMPATAAQQQKQKELAESMIANSGKEVDGDEKNKYIEENANKVTIKVIDQHNIFWVGFVRSINQTTITCPASFLGNNSTKDVTTTNGKHYTLKCHQDSDLHYTITLIAAEPVEAVRQQLPQLPQRQCIFLDSQGQNVNASGGPKTAAGMCDDSKSVYFLNALNKDAVGSEQNDPFKNLCFEFTHVVPSASTKLENTFEDLGGKVNLSANLNSQMQSLSFDQFVRQQLELYGTTFQVSDKNGSKTSTPVGKTFRWRAIWYAPNSIGNNPNPLPPAMDTQVEVEIRTTEGTYQTTWSYETTSYVGLRCDNTYGPVYTVKLIMKVNSFQAAVNN